MSREQRQRREALASQAADLPAHIVMFNGSRCDMAVGPCSCGAVHNLAEYTERLERLAWGARP